MARKQFFVSPSGGAWIVQSAGAMLTTHKTQAEAIRGAVDFAHKQKDDAQVMVQAANGKFRVEWTHGRDPYPPKG